MTYLLPLLCLACISLCVGIPDPRRREALMQQEASMHTGGRLLLTEAEKKLSAHLQLLKQKEMLNEPFLPSMHFFRARPLIQSSPIFGLLQKMPKGAVLHIHSSSLVGADWMVKNVTYRPHCYVCFTQERTVRFLFSTQPPQPCSQCSSWVLLETLRASMTSTSIFDDSLIQNLTLFTGDPEATYPSQDVVWKKFDQTFMASSGLVSHAPVFKDYFYQGLQELYNDKVMYLELRAGLAETYELDGSKHDKAWSLKAYRDIARQFAERYPDFVGARIIYAAHRSLSISQVSRAVEEAIYFQKEFPDVLAGFDLVGREDGHRSLWYFREALSQSSKLEAPLPFFFHAGETDQQGTDVDENMLDALLLNTSRLGHGFAMLRHPLVKELYRQQDVAIEVCPISNQVLGLISDLRNHPAAVLMSEGHPLVISSDDPAHFGASGLSYDFYEAFVGLGGLSSNLGTLKELALNSIRYSSLSPQLKEKALAIWQRQWDKFISENTQ